MRARRPIVLAVAAAVVLAGAVTLTYVLTRPHDPPRVGLPLRQVGRLTLPGDGSRFDYASLDAARGLLFVAHLGASQVIEVDVRAGRVVRTIGSLADVHGVLVVPDRHRVYATATGANQLTTLDEDTGTVLRRSPTGDYPDGLAYDPTRGTVWTTNESGGSETVVDAATGTVRGTVTLGGDAGNVAYDPTGHHVLVDVQTRNEIAVIDPATLTITRRIAVPGCDHDHGLALDPPDRLAFVACDGNATLHTLDLTTGHIRDHHTVGTDPDVLAYDPAGHTLYVAAESGWVTTLDNHDRDLVLTGRAHLADGAHVVAVDPTTHRSYYPVPNGNHPILLTFQPTR